MKPACEGPPVNAARAQTATREIASRQTFHRAAHYDPSLPHDLVTMLWNNPASLGNPGKRLQAKGARRTVLLEWNSQPFVLKHYREPTRRHALKQLIQPSRAWKTWDFPHRLLQGGGATPPPPAPVAKSWGLLPTS